jgi:hypothetical protein
MGDVRGGHRNRLALGLAFGAILFVLGATANSGGYRYGVSDQAFYSVTVVKALHPTFFPRDTPMLEVESRFMWPDKIVAGLVRTLGMDEPTVDLALYLMTLVLLYAATVTFGRAAGLSWWAVAALVVVVTFRHRIARTGANSLEGYMHPRMLSFAFGVLALAAVLPRRFGRAVAWLVVAACWHPTTALWFGIPVAAAVPVARPDWRRSLLAVSGVAGLFAAWVVLWGPLAGRLVVMDPAWLDVLSVKDYLFPHQWPLFAWLVNLAYPAVLLAVYRRRRSRGVLAQGESALVAGLLSLFGVFLISLPFTTLRVALAVQLQVTRAFWLLDFATAAYLAWWLLDDRLAGRRAARIVALSVLAIASAARGTYLISQDRHMFAPRLPDTPWVEAMNWLKDRPSSWYVLAHQDHAWKYGVSVRLAAEKDTLVEAGKDTSVAMYDRGVALSVGERLWEVREFDHFTTADVRRLAARYGLDVAVMEANHPLDLPELYRNRQFVIYKLRSKE